MYIVVSTWEVQPDKDEGFRTESKKMRAMLAGQPGVKFIEAIKGDGHYVAIHGYEDEAAYQRIVQDPNGPFNQALGQNRIEDFGTWVSSEKGESLD